MNIEDFIGVGAGAVVASGIIALEVIKDRRARRSWERYQRMKYAAPVGSSAVPQIGHISLEEILSRLPPGCTLRTYEEFTMDGWRIHAQLDLHAEYFLSNDVIRDDKTGDFERLIGSMLHEALIRELRDYLERYGT